MAYALKSIEEEGVETELRRLASLDIGLATPVEPVGLDESVLSKMTFTHCMTK